MKRIIFFILFPLTIQTMDYGTFSTNDLEDNSRVSTLKDLCLNYIAQHWSKKPLPSKPQLPAALEDEIANRMPSNEYHLFWILNKLIRNGDEDKKAKRIASFKVRKKNISFSFSKASKLKKIKNVFRASVSSINTDETDIELGARQEMEHLLKEVENDILEEKKDCYRTCSIFCCISCCCSAIIGGAITGLVYFSISCNDCFATNNNVT